MDPLAVSVLVIKSLESLADPIFSNEQCIDLLSLGCSDEALDVKYTIIKSVIECVPEAKRSECAGLSPCIG